MNKNAKIIIERTEDHTRVEVEGDKIMLMQMICGMMDRSDFFKELMTDTVEAYETYKKFEESNLSIEDYLNSRMN